MGKKSINFSTVIKLCVSAFTLLYFTDFDDDCFPQNNNNKETIFAFSKKFQ
jgi:hypothetical protein